MAASMRLRVVCFIVLALDCLTVWNCWQVCCIRCESGIATPRTRLRRLHDDDATQGVLGWRRPWFTRIGDSDSTPRYSGGRSCAGLGLGLEASGRLLERQ